MTTYASLRRPSAPRVLGVLALTQLLVACEASPQGFTELDPSAIDGADVERIIRVLAADDMEGRASFTPAAERTAAFIAGEFATAGLETMEGADGYLQTFAMYGVSVDETEVRVDGATVGAVGARLTEAEVRWSTGDARLVVVGPDDNAQEVLVGFLRGGSGDVLVLLDPAHAAVLEGQLGRFLRSPNRTTQLGSANLVVAVAAAGADATYEVSARATVSESLLTNVVATIPGRRSDEIVLFSAHHDHVGVRAPVDGDSIYNGANDDASGTTAVISLAKYYAQRGTPERTLLFVAFAAEEMGGYGSTYFSQQLDPDRIVAMFNIEMIGKPAVAGPNTAWITGFERSSFGTLLQEAVQGTGYEFYPDPYPDQNLFYRSDNATLARLGVPAHSISTTPIDVDPDYHRPSDEVETLDLDHLANTIRAIALGAETMVTGEAAPTRVDPATVR